MPIELLSLLELPKEPSQREGIAALLEALPMTMARGLAPEVGFDVFSDGLVELFQTERGVKKGLRDLVDGIITADPRPRTTRGPT